MAQARSANSRSARLKRVKVRRAVVLANAGAGPRAFTRAHAANLKSRLSAAFERAGVTVEIRLLDGKRLQKAASKALAEARRGDIDAVIAGGGDGSIRAVAGVLAGTRVPLGIIPLGTRNHFAKDVGLPLDIEGAAATIANGQTSLVDLGEVNGEIFINNSSIGIYPYLIIERDRRRARDGLAKWTAMVPAFLRMLRHFPRRRLRISAEDFARPYRTPCLFVGNNEYGMELFTFRRRHRLDTGRLWFYVVKPRTPLAFFWMACRMSFGRLNEARDLDRFELAEAEVSARAIQISVALDGEISFMHTPLHYRSRAQALRVIVPGTVR
ncbi:MAG TPA: diacylglycerol kinase family protein [Methyloceanibacter sp.]|nr:diacylglycerol kinase family protein [Methyloceanibacter sp.]